MRVLIHVAHLSGVGHHVRAEQVARALAVRHEVLLVDGGRRIPRPPSSERLRRLPLAPIARGPGGLRAVEDGCDMASVMAERRATLRRAVSRLRPQVLLVEHFPFGKWELHDEIVDLVRAVREAEPAARVVGSLRDIWTERRHGGAAATEHGPRVLALLAEHFDALFVHTDPAFTRLEEHFPEIASSRVPVFTTGIVSEAAEAPREDAAPSGADAPPRGHGRVVLSVGGGAGGSDVQLRVIEAWRILSGEGAVGRRVLAIFPGLFATGPELARLQAATAEGPFELNEFGPGFLPHLARADLSISRAGYNTCANLLQTRCRALLLPDPRMADQHRRADRMARLGLASVLADDAATVERMLEAVPETLAGPRPVHDLDLDGARRTVARLEQLVVGYPAKYSSHSALKSSSESP